MDRSVKFPLNGVVSLVTGASSGIGEAVAILLAGLGSRVALVARRRDRLEHLSARIVERSGEALVVQADISFVEEARGAVQETIDAYKRIDVLVNNAGVMLLGPATDAPLEEWKSMIDVNLNGLLFITHTALPHLIKAAQTSERRVADMINISSVAGRRTHPGAAVYNLTKYGVAGLSGALRQELKDRHVRVSVVEPGLVDTELPVHSRPAIKDQLAKLIGGIERLKPQDVAEIIAFIIIRPARVLLDEVMITPTAQNF